MSAVAEAAAAVLNGTTTNITYQKIPVEKSYDVSQLLLNSFFKEEPLGLLLGLSLDQVSRWIPKYIESAIEQNLSIMAVTTTTTASANDDEDECHLEETIVGVSINISESLNILNFIDKTLEPNMWNVGQYLHLLEESVRDHPGADLKTIHCLFLNVLIDYAGRGIAKTLALKSEELAKDAGCICLEVETTSEFSYRVYSNLGYIKIGELPFDEFKDENGEPLIKNINGVHKSGRVMWKRLSTETS